MSDHAPALGHTDIPADAAVEFDQMMAEIDRLFRRMDERRADIIRLRAETEAIKVETERYRADTSDTFRRLGIPV